MPLSTSSRPPESHAADLVALAGIEPGMTVLEPSAGHGMLARRRRAAGAKVDAVELAVDLRENIAGERVWSGGGDFMDTTPAHLMTPCDEPAVLQMTWILTMYAMLATHLKAGRAVGGDCVGHGGGSPNNNRTKPSVSGLTGWEAVSRPCRMVHLGVAQPTGDAYKIFGYRQTRQRRSPLPSPEGKRGDGGNPQTGQKASRCNTG